MCFKKEMEISYISEKNMGKTCNENVPYFCVEFKFSAGLVALKQLGIKEVSWQKSLDVRINFIINSRQRLFPRMGL